jgi:hypothetical protein
MPDVAHFVDPNEIYHQEQESLEIGEFGFMK